MSFLYILLLFLEFFNLPIISSITIKIESLFFFNNRLISKFWWKNILISDFYKNYNEYGLTTEITGMFQEFIYTFYKKHGREFPFRKNITPYNVLISEIMLQQTQTKRVSEKFLNFIRIFPDFQTLSEAPLEDVLKEWQGLGYNRRAIALKKIAGIVIKVHNGNLPKSLEELKSFPQIGHNTASSILTFAFNQPTIFVETNIRAVFIYYFFQNNKIVNDKDILPLIEKTFDKKNPREWCYALMDYGVMLKKKFPELNKKSAHYRKQSPFKGSARQIRGKILKILVEKKQISKTELKNNFKHINYDLMDKIFLQLESEGFIESKGEFVKIKK